MSGPQIQPWLCETEAAALGPPIDEQCNAPTVYEFFYKHATSGQFNSYDPDNPPPAAVIATTTTDEGNEVPYIVRRETGTLNRGIYQIAVLFDPSQPWDPWASQPGWNHKLYWVFGPSCGLGHRQKTSPGNVLTDMALSRGYMVAASTLTVLGNQCSTTVEAEVVTMTKEHIAERYGSIRYTFGEGSSGGAIGQHGIANQYPGLLDGLRPTSSFADIWSIVTVNSFDCPLLLNYFNNLSPTLWPNPVARDAMYGYENGHAFCTQPLGGWRPELGDPDSRENAGSTTEGKEPCVPVEHIYEAETNPGGVRCTLQDYMVNIFGNRPDDGFANRMLDNVGVQYGLQALQDGAISPEQFVDLNEKVGGWDIDANLQSQRSEADLPALEWMYRSGQIVYGTELASVAIIDNRSNWNSDVHDNHQAATTRERLAGHVTRVAGAGRYATSAAVADAALAAGITPAVIWVATGADFPDALVAGAAAGPDQGVLLLVDGADLAGSPETRDWLAGHADAVEEVRIAGGTAALSTAVERRWERCCRGRATTVRSRAVVALTLACV